jgi:hypothetical protein
MVHSKITSNSQKLGTHDTGKNHTKIQNEMFLKYLMSGALVNEP